jgi:uncharacterized protein (DUF2132 family)
VSTTPTPAQPRNPLHGLTLETILTALVAHYGWPGLADRIAVRCFSVDPSINSSLKFLRKTPWAREKVESLYLFMLREQRRASGRPEPGPAFTHRVRNVAVCADPGSEAAAARYTMAPRVHRQKTCSQVTQETKYVSA